MSRLLKASLVVVALVIGQTVLSIGPAQAAANPTFKVTATVKSSLGKTLLWLSRTGRVVATKAITSNSQSISLSSAAKISRTNINGSTLHLVTSSGGDYYGPVVLGWKSSSQVYTQMNFGTSSTSLAFGSMTRVTVTSKQGYVKVATKSTKVLTTTKATIKAVSYKPKGVGTYGKLTTSSTPSALRPLSLGALSSTDVNLNAVRTFVTDPQENNYTAADPDADGLPNFADINDDGDTKTDALDSTTPAPPSGPVPSTSCEAGASFTIFTNFKSTSPNFMGNINAYGPGSFEATTDSMSTALTSTLTMVLSPISNVCGSAVTKTEFKGVGVPYAPTDFVDITDSLSGGPGDYQWAIGQGRINGHAVDGLSAYTFTSPSEISGQDTFIQRVTTADGKSYDFTTTAGFVFVTHPLPLEFSVDDGATWTSFFNSERTSADYGRISLGGTVKIHMFRPQRLAVDGEKAADGVTAATFMDLGGMKYTPDMPNDINGNRVGKCDAAMFTDGTLTADAPVVDRADAATRMMTITWDLRTSCTDHAHPNPITWLDGTNFDVDIQVEPQGRGGNSAQKINFTMIDGG